MKRLGELLRSLPLPSAEPAPRAVRCDEALVHDLGAGLPAGHLHVWGGPPGAGKTSFLLSLLYGAARRDRCVVYATYHLAAETLALRLLSMATSLPGDALLSGALDETQAGRAARARACLDALPFFILEARGLSAESLEDRLVRMPARPDVVAVDYLQAVIRPAGVDLGSTLRALSAMAVRLHLGVVVAHQATGDGVELPGLGDREGWIAPAGGSGDRRARVLRNRYGDRPEVPLRIDPLTGHLRRLEEASSNGHDPA